MEAGAQAGQRNVCPDVKALPRWRVEGGRVPGPSQQVESHLPGLASQQMALLRAAVRPAPREQQGQLGTVLPSQHQHQRSWPGAPVKGINIRRPMLQCEPSSEQKDPPGNRACGVEGWRVCRINLIKSCFGDQAKFSSCLGCWLDSFPATPSHLPAVHPAGD